MGADPLTGFTRSFLILLFVPTKSKTMKLKGVTKVRSAIKIFSYYFSYNVSLDINFTGFLESRHI